MRSVFTIVIFCFTINLFAQTESNFDSLRIKSDSTGGESETDTILYEQIVALNKIAWEKYYAFDYYGAVIVFTEAIVLSPADPVLYYGRGVSKAKLSSYTEAFEDFSQAISLNPKFPDPYFNRGCIKMIQKDDNGAFWDFTTCLAMDSTYANAYYGRSDIYLRSNQYEAALKDLIKLRDLRPDYPNAYFAIGQVYKSLKQNDDAILNYSKAIELNEEYVDAYYSRAIVYIKKHDYNNAVEDYSSAIKYCKTDSAKLGLFHSERGHCYGVLEKYTEAFDDFETSFKIFPKDGKLYWNRGSVYGLKGQFTKAIEDFNIALKYLSNDSISSSDLYLNIGKAYKYLDNCKEAIVNFDKAVLLNPKNGNAFHYRGLCKETLKDLKGAKDDMEKAVIAQPDCACNKSEKYLEKLKAMLTKSVDKKYNIKVYPTVFTNSFNVDISVDEESENNITLILTDMNGRVVKRFYSTNTDHIEVTSENLVPGVYLYEISNGGNRLETGKVILK